MSTADRLKDQVAIVGIGTRPHVRDAGLTGRTMALRACRDAIRDAGLTAQDIDGIAGSTDVAAYEIASGLGLPAVHWWVNTPIPFTFQIIEAANAVLSGACTAAVAYHSTYRLGGTSRSAGGDPFRARAGLGLNRPSPTPDSIFGAPGYAAWTSRYLHEYSVDRSRLGLIAINSRTNAAGNPDAAISTPMTMDDYLNARMVREPLSILDMDYPCDAADAVVVTTVERARDLPHPPVILHSATNGMTAHPDEDQQVDLNHTGQQVVVERLWRNSDVGLNDVDVYFPYDGFTILALRWFEAIGYCGDGEAGDFVTDNWDSASNRIMIDGKVPVNTHGGSLSGGGTQGSGHIREAALQLRGQAGPRQVADAKVALLTPGGFFFNAGGMVLRRE
jgi:acetyl-CoA acetyltransferase